MPKPSPAPQHLPDAAPVTVRWFPGRVAAIEVALGLILLMVAAGWSLT